MKPEETPAPPEGEYMKCKHCGAEYSKDAIDRMKLKVVRLTCCGDYLERHPKYLSVQLNRPPTESSSIGSKSVVEGCTNHYADGSKIFPNRDCCSPSAGEVMTEVPTPRTDAEGNWNQSHCIGGLVPTVFARQLERETIALRQQLAAEQAKVAAFELALERAKMSNGIVAGERDQLQQQLAAMPVSVDEANELRDILRTITNSGTALKTSARELVAGWEQRGTERDAAIARAEEGEAKFQKAFEWNKLTELELKNLHSLVADLTQDIDSIDMLRDEFQRIKSCPGVTDEIAGLCERALLDIKQKVSVITQRDNAISALPTLRKAVEEVRDQLIWSLEHCALIAKSSKMKTRRGGMTPDNMEPGFTISWMSADGTEISLGAEEQELTAEAIVSKAMKIESERALNAEGGR